MWGAIKKAINSNLSKPLDVLIQEKATETNNKVDNKASQTSVDILNSKTGTVADTGGTASAGSIFAKLNKLLTDWTTTRAGYLDNINANVGRVVKNVQYGIVTPAANTISVQVSHSIVNMNKSVIFLNGGQGLDSTTMPLRPYIHARDIGGFILKMGTSDPRFAPYSPISWQLIEFY